MVDAVSFVEEKDFKKVKLEDQIPKLKEAGKSAGNDVDVHKVDQVPGVPQIVAYMKQMTQESRWIATL